MQMTLKWLKRSGKHLEDIYIYHAQNNEKIAAELYNTLIDAAESLIKFPQLGMIEPILEDSSKCYRSLIVEKHYKIIYRVDSYIIKIVAVWDCRRDSTRLKKMLKQK